MKNSSKSSAIIKRLQNILQKCFISSLYIHVAREGGDALEDVDTAGGAGHLHGLAQLGREGREQIVRIGNSYRK